MQILGIEENFLSIENEFSNYEDSKFIILPIPYEHSVSYGRGTSNAPKAILDASAFVEFYDEEFDNEICFSDKIATFRPINLENYYDEPLTKYIEKIIDKLISDNKIVVTIGGEHTISIAPIKSHYKIYPEMSILHFDAHSDLRDTYQDSKYSHACFMSRVCEFFPPSKVTQVGIRALCKEEREFIKNNKINTFFATDIRNGKFGNDSLVLGNLVNISGDLEQAAGNKHYAMRNGLGTESKDIPSV